MSFLRENLFSSRHFVTTLIVLAFFADASAIFGQRQGQGQYDSQQLQVTQDGRQVMYTPSSQEEIYGQTATQIAYLPQSDDNSLWDYDDSPYSYDNDVSARSTGSVYGGGTQPRKRSPFSLFSFDFLWSPKNDEVRFRESSRNTSGERARMLQGASIAASYVPGLGSRGLTMARLRAGATLGLPGIGKNCYCLVSPSFEPTFVDWDGPESFPDTLYNTSLSCTMIKQLNDRWGAMLSVAPRWSSDGRETKDAVGCPIIGGMIWNKSPQLQIRFGIAYLDRNDSYNIMPFGGVVWQPNDDWKFELMAPQLRVLRRCHYFRSSLPVGSGTEHWAYVGIGFGGGTWAIESVGGRADVADYKEYSLVLGFESQRKERFSWKAEFGYVFSREIEFDNHTLPDFKIDDSLVFRLTLSM